MPIQRGLPRLDPDNRFFWTSGAEGVLRLLQCADCSKFVHPPRPVCSGCLSENVAPKDMPGTGVVDTYTINYQKWHPAIDAPYIIARVAVDGAPGVILTTNIVNCPIAAIDFGDRVRVVFEQQGDVYLPLFERIA